MEADKQEELLVFLSGLEEKLAFPKSQDRLSELAQRKSRILTIQNGSRRGLDTSKGAKLHEGSLRALWAERAKKNLEAKQAAPEGAVKAEALKWENKRLAEAKAKLEAQLRDQQRRLGQMEEAAAESRRPHKHAPANGQGRLQNLHTPFKARAGSAEADRLHEALSAALTDRDAARQMCQGVRAMLAQSEALRKADPDKKVQLLQTETIQLRTALTKARTEVTACQQEMRKVQMERNLARHMLLEVKQSVAADEMARAHSLQELKASLMRDKSASETKLAELEAKCLSSTLALRRAEQQQSSDKSMIYSLTQTCAKLRAEVKGFARENASMRERMHSILEEQKKKTLEVVRAAECARAQMLCEKAAAEHDLVQAVAAREGLEQQLQEMQASLAGSAGSSPHQAAAGVNAESPFAKHSGVVQEMQGQVARLKTENATLRAEVAEQRAEVAELRSAAARKGISLGKSPRLGENGHQSLPSSPDLETKPEAAANGPQTPPTGSTDAVSRGLAHGNGSADSSARKSSPGIDTHRWRPGSAHPLAFAEASPAHGSPARSDSSSSKPDLVSHRVSEQDCAPAGERPDSLSRSNTARRLSGLGWPDEDGTSERFWSARSRAGSTASSIYLDAESKLGSEASYELTPARSGALAQMQEKLVAAHEELEQLSAAKADTARLAALRGRAAEAQGAALCAAEASLARKRAALAQAQAAAEAAAAALERIRIERQADDVKMQEMAAELKASRTKGDDEKQRLADADAVLRQEVDALRKEQESAQGKVGELQMELMRTSTQSNAAIQHFEQTIALLTSERGAAEQAVDQARQAATAADLRVRQLQGELAAAASEREWAQESTGALQARIEELLRERKAQSCTAVLSLEAELADACSALAQAKGDAAQAQEEVALLRRQLAQRGVLQALPNDSFNMGTWLSRKFERSRSARSSGRPSSVPTHTSLAKAVVQQ